MSLCDLMVVAPFIVLMQSANAVMILSAVVNDGFVMCLCLSCIVSVMRSLFVALIWHACVR